jgi:hypothetical protein
LSFKGAGSFPPGYAGTATSFGRPAVRQWLPRVEAPEDIENASRERLTDARRALKAPQG